MCDPITLAMIATGVSTTMAVGSAGAQQIEAENQAKFAQQKGEAEASVIRRRGAELLSKQRTRIAGAGILPTGSAELVLMETAKNTEYDVVMNKYNASLQSNAMRNAARAKSMEAYGAIASGAAQAAQNEQIFKET